MRPILRFTSAAFAVSRWASDSGPRVLTVALAAAAPVAFLAVQPIACAPSAFVTASNADATDEVVPIIVAPPDDAQGDGGTDASEDGSLEGTDSGPCTPAGTGALGVAGCPCSTAGETVCAGNAQVQLLICQNGKWAPNGQCLPGQLCNSKHGPSQGTCAVQPSLCVGATPNQFFCSDYNTAVRCNTDLIATTYDFACMHAICSDGGCTGECGVFGPFMDGSAPDGGLGPGVTVDHACMGGMLRACTLSGTYDGGILCPSLCCNDACKDQTSDPDNCGGCGHSCMSGACVGSVCQPATLSSPGDAGTLVGPIAIDSRNVYVTSTSGIMSAPLVDAGSTLHLITSRTGAVALATDGTDVYWTEPANGAVLAVSVAGGNPVTIGVTQGTADHIAVAGSQIFFTDSTVSSGIVYVIPPGGGQVPVYSGHYPIVALTLDAQNLYFAESGCSGAPSVCSRQIWSVPLAAIAARDAGAPTPIASDRAAADLAVSPDQIYWTNVSKCPATDSGLGCNYVESAPLDGGAAVTIASQQSLAGPLAVDSMRLYVVGGPGILAWSLPADGGAPSTLAAAVAPFGLTQDDTFLYWTDLGTNQVSRLVKQ
jgi:hypothetical protein